MSAAPIPGPPGPSGPPDPPGSMGSSWRRLGAVAPAGLGDTRLTLHHAVQLLASFGQTLVTARADDSHRAMTWDEDARGFRSGASADGLHALLRLPGLTLEVHRGDRRLDGLELRGRTLTHARGWLGDAVGRARGTEAVSLAWPEYEVPPRPGGPDGPLDPEADALTELTAWYANAALVLAAVAGLPEASKIRCWPHHFDLATLLTFPAADAGGEARFIGLGFSPGDASRPAPYYYVNGWPPPLPESLPGLPGLKGPGSWNTEGWVGAVLGAEEIVARLDVARQEATVNDFLDAAVGAMRAAVLPEP